MKRLHTYSIRHPVLVVTLAALVLLAVAPGISRLRLRTDGSALVPEHTPEIRLDREVRQAFGVRDPLVVLIRPRHPDGIFNPRTLHLVADLSAAFARIPGLDSSSVRSLSTEISDRFRPGQLVHRRLLEPVPESRAELDTLRGDLEAIGLLTGTLVSFDGGAAAILLGVPTQGDRKAFLSGVEGVIARGDTAGHEVRIIGAPVAEALLGSHILRDLGISWGASDPLTRWVTEHTGPGPGSVSRLRAAIAGHIGLLPLSVVVMALVFILCFRSVVAAVIPLSEAAACLVFVLGLMGWTGVPIYLTMAVLPVILVSLGLADELHIFACYSRHRAERPQEPVDQTVQAAMDEMCLPVVATSLTCAIGFLSFAISPLRPVQAFGLLTAVGILFCLSWTLTVVPAALVLLKPRGFHRSNGAASSPGTLRLEGWGRLADFAARRSTATLTVVALLLVLTPLGIRRLVVQDSWIGGFARDSEFYRATQYFNQHFFGTHMLLLALDTGHVQISGSLTPADMGMNELRLPPDLVPDPALLTGCALAVTRRGPPGPAGSPPSRMSQPASWESVVESAERRGGHIVITTPLVHGSALFLLASANAETLRYALDSRRLALPDVLKGVGDFERFIRQQTQYTVGGVLGPADQVETAAFLTNDRAPESRAIPRNPDTVRWLWSAIEQVQGSARVRQVVDPRFERGLVSVFLKNANFVDTAHLMGALRQYERTTLAPQRIRFDFAGDVAVSQTLVRAIVQSQVGSLLLSVLGILFVTAILFRSLRWGLICMVPAGLAVAVTFAVMGWMEMPLGVATSMFASMVLGIGVDFAIHMAERYRVAVPEARDRRAAILESLTATGPAVVINGCAVALGFGVLVLSQVPANAQLGAITVVSLLSCLAATLLVIPALINVAARA